MYKQGYVENIRATPKSWWSDKKVSELPLKVWSFDVYLRNYEIIYHPIDRHHIPLHLK